MRHLVCSVGCVLVGQLRQNVGGYGSVVEGDGAGGEDLDALGAFSGKEDDVVGRGRADGGLDGAATITLDDAGGAGGFDANEGLGEDGVGVFGAGVVAGKDNEVAAFASGTAHLGALGLVAVAATAEEGDDLTAMRSD